MKLTLPIESESPICAPAEVPIVTIPPATETCSEYLLVCEARSTTLTDGYWRFALETAEGEAVLDAEDTELGDLNRLTLYAAIRGLESIEGPSSVTLLSNNRYLIRSLSDSLPRWRQNDFMWEHFGRRIDVQHADLWRRIDRALQIHRVEACLVSSRLVSSGLADANQVSDSGIVTRRVDSRHAIGAGERVVPAAKMNLRSAKGTSDRLRRWLMAGSGADATPPKRRFTPADLAQRS
ncbi:MAG: ribonuclease HI [Pirellulaceae bacterium]|nr:ribonuclease HI [Pirellulaceae bacterium]